MPRKKIFYGRNPYFKGNPRRNRQFAPRRRHFYPRSYYIYHQVQPNYTTTSVQIAANTSPKNIKSKIKSIQQKINAEIKNREQIVPDISSLDLDCLDISDNKYSLKKDFIKFIVKESNQNLIKRLKLKRFLTNLALINSDERKDVLLKDKSILKVDIKTWQDYRANLDLIKNMELPYKEYLKEQELKDVKDEYNKIFEVSKKKKGICPYCGSENSKEAVFCHYCGAQLGKN
ncbi:MAG: zinc-ribbon domain-containing protein [Candidatus Lokiarchaeota archaeon]|nr:zinc-ribbon domain-containing protein [Candidatus Lokiarchaeota archaeon]